MFAKLLKNEFKTSAGVLGVMSLAALGAGTAGGLMLRYTVNAAAAGREGVMAGMVSSMMIFIILGLLAYSFGGGFYLLYQFYRSKFTDEGYLTFTLPVRTWQIFLASLVNILLWTLIIGVVLIVSFALIFLVGLFNSEFIEQLREVLMQTYGIVPESYLTVLPQVPPVLQIAASVLEFVSENVIFMTCITIGAILARRRKLLGALGVYLGYSLISGMVTTGIMTPYLQGVSGWTMDTYYILVSLYMLTLSVGGTLLSSWLMKRKLNLP